MRSSRKNIFLHFLMCLSLLPFLLALSVSGCEKEGEMMNQALSSTQDNPLNN